MRDQVPNSKYQLPKTRKQIRLRFHFSRLGGGGKEKELESSTAADRLFKELEQRRLAGVTFESRDLGFDFVRRKFNHGRGRRERNRLAICHGEERGSVIKLLRLMRAGAVLQLLREAVAATGPVKGHGRKDRDHGVIRMRRD